MDFTNRDEKNESILFCVLDKSFVPNEKPIAYFLSELKIMLRLNLYETNIQDMHIKHDQTINPDHQRFIFEHFKMVSTVG